MRGVLVLGLLTLTGVGCVSSESMRPKGPFAHKLLSLPQGPDVVQLHATLIERRLGDDYINKTLWSSTDERAAGIDHLALLEDNGFRVGQVVGSPPGELHGMLKTERYWLYNNAFFVRVGSSTGLPLGPTVPSCTYRVKLDGHDDEIIAERAQCELLVEPTLTADGKTRLRFTPQVQYGEPLQIFEAVPDHSDSALQVRKQTHTYPALNWEVTLAPNEYLVIGTHPGQPQSLGYQALVNEDGAMPIQRLLVLRTNRGAPPAESREGAPTAASQALKSGSR